MGPGDSNSVRFSPQKRRRSTLLETVVNQRQVDVKSGQLRKQAASMRLRNKRRTRPTNAKGGYRTA